MRREDRQLLAELARLNTALPAFAQHVMNNSATPAEHHAVSQCLIALGQAIDERANALTVINPAPDNDAMIDTNITMAAASALSALLDTADALSRSHKELTVRSGQETTRFDWFE